MRPRPEGRVAEARPRQPGADWFGGWGWSDARCQVRRINGDVDGADRMLDRAGCRPAAIRPQPFFETAITRANAASLGREWTWQADWTTCRQVSDPVVSASGVHVSVGHELVTIKPGDGVDRWRTPRFDPNLPVPVLTARNPAAANGRVFLSIQSASPIVASATRGSDANTGQDLGVVAAAANDVTVPRDTKLVGSYTLSGGSSGFVLTGYFVKDLVDETKSWTANLNLFSGGGVISPSSPAVGDDKFFFANGQTLLAYPLSEPAGCVLVSGNFRSCPLAWSLGFGPGLTRPTLSGDGKFIVVGDTGHVMMLTVNGASRWTAGLPTTAPPSAPLSIDASTGFAVSAGKLVAYGRGGCGLTACSPLWSGDTAGTVALQPAIARGCRVHRNDRRCDPGVPGCGLWHRDVRAVVEVQRRRADHRRTFDLGWSGTRRNPGWARHLVPTGCDGLSQRLCLAIASGHDGADGAVAQW